MFKVYDSEGNKFFINSIGALADFCEVSVEAARKAYYKPIHDLNGFEVIRIGK